MEMDGSQQHSTAQHSTRRHKTIIRGKRKPCEVLRCAASLSVSAWLCSGV